MTTAANGSLQIAVMNLDGTGYTEITSPPALSIQPDWQRVE